MTNKRFIQVFSETLDEMLNIVKTKNKDYSGDDPFKNFKLTEYLGNTTTEKGIVVRMLDKVSRIVNLLNSEASVKSESIQDTLVDLANYAIILKIYLDKKDKNEKIYRIEKRVSAEINGDE